MTEVREIRILVADDHTLLREAVCEMLRMETGFQVVGQADDAADAVVLAGRLLPDVVLLDVGMPGNQPRATVRRLGQVAPDAQVLILSMYTDQRLVQELLNSGVRGYLHKSVSRQELVTAIRTVCADDRRVVVSVAWPGVDRSAEDEDKLSIREREVLALVAKAMSNRQIASRLEITEGTVKRHLRNIFAKLGAVSRIDAVNKGVAAAVIQRNPVSAPTAVFPAQAAGSAPN
jgi:DNA-binding NarL/FixJ family response regulator